MKSSRRSFVKGCVAAVALGLAPAFLNPTYLGLGRNQRFRFGLRGMNRSVTEVDTCISTVRGYFKVSRFMLPDPITVLSSERLEIVMEHELLDGEEIMGMKVVCEDREIYCGPETIIYESYNDIVDNGVNYMAKDTIWPTQIIQCAPLDDQQMIPI